MMHFDTSMESLIGFGRSESVADLNSELVGHLLQQQTGSTGSTAASARSRTDSRNRHSFAGKGYNDISELTAANKSFGLGELHVYLQSFNFYEFYCCYVATSI